MIQNTIIVNIMIATLMVLFTYENGICKCVGTTSSDNQ